MGKLTATAIKQISPKPNPSSWSMEMGSTCWCNRGARSIGATTTDSLASGKRSRSGSIPRWRIAEPYFNLRKNFWDVGSNLADNLDQYIQAGVGITPGYADTTSRNARRRIFRNLENMARVENARQFSIDLQPLVITLGNRVITLNGNVEDQYQEWRDILKQLYLLDRGLAESPSPDRAPLPRPR
jgi:hypothetical protein